MSNIDTFIEGCKEFAIELDDKQKSQFILFKDLLKEWNEKINITAIKDDVEVDIKHFLDSVSIFKSGKIRKGLSVIDIGTGGGFPGVPINIIEPGCDVTLFDSLNKRLIFLDEVINKLELSNIRTIHGRAEEYGRKEDYREQYDIATSRAVASLDTLCEYTMPFVKVGGYFIAMKGPGVDEEMDNSKEAIKLLGGQLEDIIEVKLPSSDIVHNLVIIKKINYTPTKYPRGGGKPKKNPL